MATTSVENNVLIGFDDEGNETRLLEYLDLPKEEKEQVTRALSRWWENEGHLASKK